MVYMVLSPIGKPATQLSSLDFDADSDTLCMANRGRPDTELQVNHDVKKTGQWEP